VVVTPCGCENVSLSAEGGVVDEALVDQVYVDET